MRTSSAWRWPRSSPRWAGPIPLPPLPVVTPDTVDPPGYFGVLVALSTVPFARAYHRRHGIDEVTSWRTFVDIGRNIAVYRNRHGRPGFDDLDWVSLHLTGQLYDLGRLQVARAQLGGTFTRLIREHGLDVEEGEPCLDIHIPRYSGPMDITACDRSLTRATEFFPRHFPEESPRYLVCSSWLLDPVLAERLPARSNIVAFQRHFTIARCHEPGDEATMIFVFEDPTRPFSAYPRSSSLQRAVLEHLEAGGHWHGGRGWLCTGSHPSCRVAAGLGSYYSSMLSQPMPTALVGSGMKALARSGRVVLIGMGADDVSINVPLVQGHELTITGTFRYANTYPLALELIASGAVDVAGVITHHFDIDHTVDALTLAAGDPNSLKSIVSLNRRCLLRFGCGSEQQRT